MELKLIWKHARAAVLECCEGSIYEMAQPCQIYLNGEFYKETKIVSIFVIRMDTANMYSVKNLLQWMRELHRLKNCVLEIFRQKTVMWQQHFSMDSRNRKLSGWK